MQLAGEDGSRQLGFKLGKVIHRSARLRGNAHGDIGGLGRVGERATLMKSTPVSA